MPTTATPTFHLGITMAGAGSAGFGIYKILTAAGCRDIIVTDSRGAIYQGRDASPASGNGTNKYKDEIASKTNLNRVSGDLATIIAGADVFIGVSGRGGLVAQ
ncbi:MAG: hypothetical protein ACTHM5_04100, partial [Ginsengibacter sp.]